MASSSEAQSALCAEDAVGDADTPCTAFFCLQLGRNALLCKVRSRLSTNP